MNNILLAFLLFVITNSSCAQDRPVIDSRILKEIKIEYVDIAIETPMNVPCGEFETYFESQIKTKEILETSEINKVSRIVNKFLSSAEKYSDPPDVRVKIIFIQKDGTKQTLGAGRLISSYKGINFINTKKFIPDILRKLDSEK